MSVTLCIFSPIAIIDCTPTQNPDLWIAPIPVDWLYLRAPLAFLNPYFGDEVGRIQDFKGLQSLCLHLQCLHFPNRKFNRGVCYEIQLSIPLSSVFHCTVVEFCGEHTV